MVYRCDSAPSKTDRRVSTTEHASAGPRGKEGRCKLNWGTSWVSSPEQDRIEQLLRQKVGGAKKRAFLNSSVTKTMQLISLEEESKVTLRRMCHGLK